MFFFIIKLRKRLVNLLVLQWNYWISFNIKFIIINFKIFRNSFFYIYFLNRFFYMISFFLNYIIFVFFLIWIQIANIIIFVFLIISIFINFKFFFWWHEIIINYRFNFVNYRLMRLFLRLWRFFWLTRFKFFKFLWWIFIFAFTFTEIFWIFYISNFF